MSLWECFSSLFWIAYLLENCLPVFIWNRRDIFVELVKPMIVMIATHRVAEQSWFFLMLEDGCQRGVQAAPLSLQVIATGMQDMSGGLRRPVTVPSNTSWIESEWWLGRPGPRHCLSHFLNSVQPWVWSDDNMIWVRHVWESWIAGRWLTRTKDVQDPGMDWSGKLNSCPSQSIVVCRIKCILGRWTVSRITFPGWKEQHHVFEGGSPMWLVERRPRGIFGRDPIMPHFMPLFLPEQ